MNNILAVILIIGLFVPIADPGRPRLSDKKGKRGKDGSRNPLAPSGPREFTEPRITRGIKRAAYEAFEKLRSWARPAKRARVEVDEEVAESVSIQNLPRDIAALENKWLAVIEFRHLVDTGKSSNDAVDEIAERYGVGSGRNLRLLSQYVDERGSLLRKAGSGAPRTVSNRPDILEFFDEKARSFEYTFTIELMADLIKGEFGVGSTTTVKKIMEHLDYVKKSRAVRPFLTEEHQEERLKWAKEWVNFVLFFVPYSSRDH